MAVGAKNSTFSNLLLNSPDAVSEQQRNFTLFCRWVQVIELQNQRVFFFAKDTRMALKVGKKPRYVPLPYASRVDLLSFRPEGLGLLPIGAVVCLLTLSTLRAVSVPRGNKRKSI